MPLVVLQSPSMTMEERKTAWEKMSPVVRDSYYGQLVVQRYVQQQTFRAIEGGRIDPRVQAENAEWRHRLRERDRKKEQADADRLLGHLVRALRG